MTIYFGSIASSPGKTGKHYYSKFFQYYKIDAEYIPLKADNVDELLEHLLITKYSGLNISTSLLLHTLNFAFSVIIITLIPYMVNVRPKFREAKFPAQCF